MPKASLERAITQRMDRRLPWCLNGAVITADLGEYVGNVLVHNPLNRVQALDQSFHARPIAKSNKMMAGTIKQVSPLARVEIKKDTCCDLLR